MNETDWTRLVRQLVDGSCTPFLGAGASATALPDRAQLSRQWARKYGYPFPDDGDLARVMQWAASVVGDPVSVREEVSEALAALPPPDFSTAGEPHRLLASLPLPLYVTTNYDDFMTRALQDSGRAPRRVVCPWYSSAPPAEPVTRLDATAPVVYHLHGSLHHPPSIVLTEDDYLEFLVNLAMDRGGAGTRVIPTYLQTALSRPMLFIGYSLRDWTFQVVFRGLLRTISPVQHRRHVSVQLTPLPETMEPAERQRAEDYLTRQLDRLNVSVYWGTAHDFCQELRSRM